MQIRELTTEECLELLNGMRMGHLACALAGQPYVVPIHFSFDPHQKRLYGFSGIGQKVSWMRQNPHVCVEVPDIADKNRWTTVLVFGRYEEIEDSPEHAETRKRVLDLFQQRPQWWLPATAKVGSREAPAVVIYQILIDRVTGRSTSRGPASISV
jgi:nitroimidazol reductase NimA-like FMN-containing flavoprotein (pyridoxamine 5'-phosphate oxidase superfamily)